MRNQAKNHDLPVLSAAVAFVGALAVLNLVLTLGVVRRLREHAQRLEQMHSMGPGMMAADQLYARLFTMQASGYQDRDAPW